MVSSQRERDSTNENNDSINDKYMALITYHKERKRQLPDCENDISMRYETKWVGETHAVSKTQWWCDG